MTDFTLIRSDVETTETALSQLWTSISTFLATGAGAPGELQAIIDVLSLSNLTTAATTSIGQLQDLPIGITKDFVYRYSSLSREAELVYKTKSQIYQDEELYLADLLEAEMARKVKNLGVIQGAVEDQSGVLD